MSEKEHTAPAATNETIKSKQGVDDFKARATAARKRAQEKILDKSFVSDPVDDPLERLANTFDNSAKRWEMVVYPSLFAFVLLAVYGFFLIYRLTHDIAILSQSVTQMAVIVSDVVPRMSKDITKMTGSMDNINNDIGSMSEQMNTLTPMSKNIQSMTYNLGSMNRSVYGMQRDIGGMNRTVSSGPFGMMNDMMPFSTNSNVPRPPSREWPSYNPVLQQAPHTGQPPLRHQAKSATLPSIQLPATLITSDSAVNKSTKKKVVEKTFAQEVMMPGVSSVSLKNY
ncbi:MAG: hypothetical protein JKX75_04560 [Gammaproteobacteria bacterium]|nr:hypothetical protein [Gammaproteobacteria bacterium]